MTFIARLPAPKQNRALAKPATTAVRLFVLANGDQLLRLPVAQYSRMIRKPVEHPLQSMASRRVRCAEAIVELQSRKAVRVLRMMFWSADFDERGVLDTEALGRQCVAALDAVLEALWQREYSVNIVNATARFVAGGGSWTPTEAQRGEIGKAALGEKTCVVIRR